MAKKYIISAENAEEIKEYRKGVTDKYLDRRLYAVQLLGEGMKVREIAENSMRIDVRSVCGQQNTAKVKE